MNFESEEKVFPSKNDKDLWQLTQAFLKHKFPGRVMPDHARWAFEATCDELDGYLSQKRFLRKVATKWMWQRPSLPRGMGGPLGWREIKPVNYPDDEE